MDSLKERETYYFTNDLSSCIPHRYQSMFSSGGESGEREATIRRANLVLNKLSLTKFDKLTDEFISILAGLKPPTTSSTESGSEDEAIDVDMLQRTVDMIVAKAQMEQHFSSMYADLCRKIIATWNDEIVTEGGASSTDDRNSPVPDAAGGERKTKGTVFREMLLAKCQSEFEDHDRVKALEDIKQNVNTLIIS